AEIGEADVELLEIVGSCRRLVGEDGVDLLVEEVALLPADLEEDGDLRESFLNHQVRLSFPISAAARVSTCVARFLLSAGSGRAGRTAVPRPPARLLVEFPILPALSTAARAVSGHFRHPAEWRPGALLTRWQRQRFDLPP